MYDQEDFEGLARPGGAAAQPQPDGTFPNRRIYRGYSMIDRVVLNA